jgi:ribosomal-protein-alanine N-acetyltransferase
MAEVRVREYGAADLDAMYALDCVCFAEEFRFSRRAMRAFAEARNAIALVAEDGAGGLAGFAIVHVEGPAKGRYGYVVTLDVGPAWRRHGLATRLMREVERRLAGRGVAVMALHVHTGNDAAVRFYERAGYERLGVEAGFYGAPGLDAFVYAKRLAID